MAEDEVQAHRDWMVQLLRKLETEKGLSREQAMKLVYDMADKEKVRDWLVQHLEKATPEEQEAFVQKVLAHVDIDDLDRTTTNPKAAPRPKTASHPGAPKRHPGTSGTPQSAAPHPLQNGKGASKCR